MTSTDTPESTDTPGEVCLYVGQTRNLRERFSLPHTMLVRLDYAFSRLHRYRGERIYAHDKLPVQLWFWGVCSDTVDLNTYELAAVNFWLPLFGVTWPGLGACRDSRERHMSEPGRRYPLREVERQDSLPEESGVYAFMMAYEDAAFARSVIGVMDRADVRKTVRAEDIGPLVAERHRWGVYEKRRKASPVRTFE